MSGCAPIALRQILLFDPGHVSFDDTVAAAKDNLVRKFFEIVWDQGFVEACHQLVDLVSIEEDVENFKRDLIAQWSLKGSEKLITFEFTFAKQKYRLTDAAHYLGGVSLVEPNEKNSDLLFLERISNNGEVVAKLGYSGVGTLDDLVVQALGGGRSKLGTIYGLYEDFKTKQASSGLDIKNLWSANQVVDGSFEQEQLFLAEVAACKEYLKTTPQQQKELEEEFPWLETLYRGNADKDDIFEEYLKLVLDEFDEAVKHHEERGEDNARNACYATGRAAAVFLYALREIFQDLNEEEHNHIRQFGKAAYLF